jgi:hypothetical protein
MMQALANLSDYELSHGNLTAPQIQLLGDINGDGQFNNADLQALLNNLLSGGGSAAPVPEPSTLVLAGIGALALLMRMRRRSAASLSNAAG